MERDPHRTVTQTVSLRPRGTFKPEWQAIRAVTQTVSLRPGVTFNLSGFFTSQTNSLRYFGSNGRPAFSQASNPPYSGCTFFQPCSSSLCATRALDISWFQVQ